MVRLECKASLAGYLIVDEGPGGEILWSDPTGGSWGSFKFTPGNGKAFLAHIHGGTSPELFVPVDQ